MKIVLREDVETLGRKGDLLEVADGYARNYLVPRGLAIKATKGVVAQADAMRRNREAREVRDRAAAEDLAGRLTAGGALVVSARAGEGGKLFGSVAARSSSTTRSASSARSRSRSASTPTSPSRSRSKWWPRRRSRHTPVIP
jgi:large subunit ribosomal protein L9